MRVNERWLHTYSVKLNRKVVKCGEGKDYEAMFREAAHFHEVYLKEKGVLITRLDGKIIAKRTTL